MNLKITKMINDLIDREGGFVDHPDDKGGPTKFGITKKSLASWYGCDVKKITTSDIKLLIKEDVIALYYSSYFNRPGFERLHEDLKEQVFDCAVLHGPSRAIKFLQTIVNDSGIGELIIDGILGPFTLYAILKAYELMGNYFNNAIVDERRHFIDQIVENDSTQAVFHRGWINRAVLFRKEI